MLYVYARNYTSHRLNLQMGSFGGDSELGGKPSWVYRVIFRDVLPRTFAPLGNPCNIITRSSAIATLPERRKASKSPEPHCFCGGSIIQFRICKLTPVTTCGEKTEPCFRNKHTNLSALGFFAASFTNVTSLRQTCQVWNVRVSAPGARTAMTLMI